MTEIDKKVSPRTLSGIPNVYPEIGVKLFGIKLRESYVVGGWID